MNRKSKPKPGSTPHTASSPAPPLIGGKLVSQTRVFISYRRQDTRPAAEHLHASLARRFGSERVFRDVATIEPGQDFTAVIDQAISMTSVFIALIGRRWLTIKGPGGGRRLDDPKDFVRLEIESALRQGVVVIPVLVDGARMPTANELPPSIADLATRNAYELPWHEGIARLGRRIYEIERARAEREAAERSERERLDLARGLQTVSLSNVATGAMELSLERQHNPVSLDPEDLAASMEKLTGRPIEQGFIFDDLIYVIDILGVKAKSSDDRYIARSYPLKSLDELPDQLKLGRPVLVGVLVFQSWFQELASRTGFVDYSAQPGTVQGGIFGVIVGWEPGKEQFKLLTPWPTWGDGGIATLNRAAAGQYIQLPHLRSIEAVLMPKPSNFWTSNSGKSGRRGQKQESRGQRAG